jgi:ABC-2 type transport system permease protein
MPIFDQGYQHWSGQLSGHAWRWLAITRQGVRHGMKGRFLRYILIVSWLPAIGLALMLCLWGLAERKFDAVMPVLNILVSLELLDPRVLADPKHYRVVVWTLSYNHFLLAELYLSMLLVLLVGPRLISQDLRFNALPLYFSRPLRRIDYFLGKLGIVVAFLGMVAIVPSLIAYALGLLFSLDITIIRDTFPILLSSIAYGLVIAVSAGLFILALSALSRSSRYIALFWLVILLVGMVTGFILEQVDQEQRREVYLYRNMRGGRESQQKAMAELQEAELREAKTDWRPLVSYTANLRRVGQQLLGTDKAWETLSELKPPGQREQFLLEWAGPQYPWYWSAAVLAGLLGLSACILNFRVKSLDRLR